MNVVLCVFSHFLERALTSEKVKIGSDRESKICLSIYQAGGQSWVFTGRTDAETPILWPPDAKSRLIGKDLVAGKD